MSLTPIRVGSDLLRVGGQLLAVPYAFHDDFARADGEVGRGWRNLSDDWPDDYNPAAILDGALVCGDPYSRPPGFDTPGKSEGIGGIHRETGLTDVNVRVRYSGDADNGGTDPFLLGHSIEAAAAAHFLPESSTNTRMCVGAWASFLGGGFIFVGYVGRPPDEPGLGTGGQFEVFGAAFYDHDYGVEHLLGMRTEAGHVVEVGWDDVALDLYEVVEGVGIGDQVEALPFDEELAESTRHGCTYDIHLMDPPTTTQPVIEEIWISA